MYNVVGKVCVIIKWLRMDEIIGLAPTAGTAAAPESGLQCGICHQRPTLDWTVANVYLGLTSLLTIDYLRVPLTMHICLVQIMVSSSLVYISAFGIWN